MEFTGRIIAVLEPRSGVSRSTGNPWMMQDFVIEDSMSSQFPKRMAFNVFGEDKLKAFNIQMGQELRVSFDINAREYQGRWYNDIRVYRVEPANAPAPEAAPMSAAPQPAVAAPAAQAQPAAAAPFDPTPDETSDLPF